MGLREGDVDLIIKNRDFSYGYNTILRMDDTNNDTQMDYGIIILKKNDSYEEEDEKEKAWLLIRGKVAFEWGNKRVAAERKSILDENPCCLHIPGKLKIRVTSMEGDAEIAAVRTDNKNHFAPKYYSQEECMSVESGKGELDETSLRTVRTIFDLSNAPESNLVLGEVVHRPGRWSSYPPHHHPQPEIYYYKFQPEQGFGYAEEGEEVFKVRNNDTFVIPPGLTHPQVAAPGYTMYYVWTIRHLENNPFNKRIYAPEHLWLTNRNTLK
jgi:5-deoxy-glucuronate isomerase